MTLYQFIQLDQTKQTEMLHNEGVQIGERRDANHHIILYQIGGFYVEVFYNLQQTVFRRMRSFRSIGQLRPYLDKIDISSLL